MNRYMIYMPVGTQGRLIPCGSDGSLTLAEFWDLEMEDGAWKY